MTPTPVRVPADPSWTDVAGFWVPNLGDVAASNCASDLVPMQFEGEVDPVRLACPEYGLVSVAS